MVTAAPRTWTLVLEGERPWTTNVERQWSRWTRAAKVEQWRTRAWAAALEDRVPRLAAVHIHAWPLAKNRRAMQDTGGCFPTAKACIDGLTDAGVLEHDGPEIVRALTFGAPVVGSIDGLMLTIVELA